MKKQGVLLAFTDPKVISFAHFCAPAHLLAIIDKHFDAAKQRYKEASAFQIADEIEDHLGNAPQGHRGKIANEDWTA